MGTPSIGAVVLISFPFSDLSQSKRRPAVVLADAGKGDFVRCQITSKPYADVRAIELTNASFATGSLRVVSYARPSKLFTANHSLLISVVRELMPDSLKQIIETVVDLLREGIKT